ncbi:Predicted acetyltransferase, GNAT superfamily [Paenibacillus sp. UNCCL117]|uniref:GNAT family N-acetyltransferase n=1 Tax=unclassified Paenibacillus TaxID=185978 RepID=UPI0008829BD1|nr:MULTISPECIES: GNAT family N-acetyltransferase [unclassified Paenibacillus]SDD49659.1 Predicted acetyltransferase, GNAT superfamily [Paenibacillus sp. cl123]SFW49917.1 Predicted acetyltransferase, GNAT superfamily [Paenibacillus sp. UNCCL117]
MENGSRETAAQAGERLTAQKQGNSFVLQGLNGKAGEVTFQLVDVDTWIVDHTYVDPAYRGRGLGRQLLDLVVQEAREKGRKVIPACSYALAVFQDNPDTYADVWEKERTATDYSDPYSSGSATSSGP